MIITANIFETVAIMMASTKVFQSTNEEVGLLLSAILNCKTSRLAENVNWESVAGFLLLSKFFYAYALDTTTRVSSVAYSCSACPKPLTTLGFVFAFS